jgi:hypothetical protein
VAGYFEENTTSQISMNLPTGLNTRVIRLVAALIVPGALVAVPLTSLIFQIFHDFQWVGEASKIAQGTGFLFFSVLISMMIEEIGSRIEISLYKKKFSGDEDNNWDSYLLRPLDNECIMIRYIGELVMRLKFELGMMVAWPLSAIIWLAGNLKADGDLQCPHIVGAGFALLCSYWMYIEAERTVDLLKELRRKLAAYDRSQPPLSSLAKPESQVS